MAFVNVTTTGMRNLSVKVTKRIEALRGHKLRTTVQSMAADVIRQFNVTVDSFTPGNVPDLSPRYKLAKAQRFGTAYPILKATGQMMASLFSTVRVRSRGASYQIWIGLRGSRGRITNAQLAEYHVNGTGRMPARDFMTLPPAFKRRWSSRILAALRKG